jgi:hypothetical protein
MKESAFEGVVTAIPILILIISVLIPLSAHGWNIMGTLLPANPFLGVGSGLLPGAAGGGGASQEAPMVSIQGSGLSTDGSRMFLDVMLRNPMPVEVDVEEFSAGIPAGGTTVTLALVKPVSIPSGGTALARLEAPRPQGLPSQGSPRLSTSDLSDLKMKISAGGIEMTLDENTIRGMLS